MVQLLGIIIVGDKHRGRAEIEQTGNQLQMFWTWTSNSAPAPHYKIDATIEGTEITGTWRYLIESDIERQNQGTFYATIQDDGSTIFVANTQDDSNHGFNEVVLYKTTIDDEFGNTIFLPVIRQ